MGRRNTVKKHKQHKKIRGSLACFRNTSLEEKAHSLWRGPLIANELIELRNLAKDGFGMRMRMATLMSGVFVPISEVSLEIITTHLGGFDYAPNAYRFADCFFASYNGEVHMFELNNPKYATSNKNKALKCAIKDCTKAFETYFNPILARMNNKIYAQILDSELVGKYKDIEVALAFSISYIYVLHCGKMPEKLSRSILEEAKTIDEKVAMHYQYDDYYAAFVLNKSKNNKYSTVSQECATYLICNKHK